MFVAHCTRVSFLIPGSCVVQRIQCVQQRGEIELWRSLLALWCSDWIAGVAGEPEEALVDLSVALGDLIGTSVAKGLKILYVSLNGFSEIGEREWKQIGIGETQYRDSRCLRKRPTVDERRIAEMHEPIEVVVDGVVDAAFVLTAVSKVERRNAEVIYEGRVVRSGPERANAKILPLSRLATHIRGAVQNSRRLHPFPGADTGLRVFDVHCDAVHELLERVRSFDTQVSAAVGVAVEIGDGVCLQLVGVRFHPLGRSEQPRLLSVPPGVDDGTLRAPTLLVESAGSTCFLQLRDESGNRILRAVHPSVVVVSANHPLVRFGGAWKPGDDIVERFQAPVRFD